MRERETNVMNEIDRARHETCSTVTTHHTIKQELNTLSQKKKRDAPAGICRTPLSSSTWSCRAHGGPSSASDPTRTQRRSPAREVKKKKAISRLNREGRESKNRKEHTTRRCHRGKRTHIATRATHNYHVRQHQRWRRLARRAWRCRVATNETKKREEEKSK